MSETEPTPPPAMKKLEGKVAIITGGASGIGEATARHFADHGARAVVIADVQLEKGRQVAASIGPRCTFITCDVSDETQVISLVQSTVQAHGQVDIMFSNAGVFCATDQGILDFDLDACDRLFKTNVLGVAACVKHAARAMVERSVKGSIVCTASIAATVGTETFIDYIMSKHAVLGLVRSASRGLGGHGIRVNCVSPGLVATPLLSESRAADVEKAFASLKPLKGVGVMKVKDIADAVLFLASDESLFVTGHNLVVDGGPHY